MRNTAVKNILTISLFWGSLWGIAEATLGYIFHLVTVIPGIAGFFMFPIGFYCMTRAYRESGKSASLLITAAAAAAIKLVDLFLPAVSPIKTLNPAAAILLEGVVVMVMLHHLAKKSLEFRFRHILAAAAAWRVGFVFYSLLFYFSF